MPRVLPSEVVDAIDQFFEWGRGPDEVGTTSPRLSMLRAGETGALLGLVDHVPDELITLTGRDRVQFLASIAAMRVSLARWRLGEHDHYLIVLPGTRYVSPVRTLRAALAKCPDEVPAPMTAELPFIADRDLRESLRLDLSEAHAALRNGQWKAATVLGGSLLEALLLWAIPGAKTPRPHGRRTRRSLLAQLRSRGRMTKSRRPCTSTSPSPSGSETAQAAQLAKGFRNLVHSGRSRRLSQAPSRGTAHIVLGAVELVAEDLRRQMATDLEDVT